MRTALPFGVVLAMACAGGLVSLSYEIFFFRTMSYATGSSPFAFATTLGAFLVDDAWQRKGIGRFLFDLLIRVGRARGIRRFTAEVMADNHAMLKVFHQSRVPVQSVLEGGIYRLSFELSAKTGSPPASAAPAAAAPNPPAAGAAERKTVPAAPK